MQTPSAPPPDFYPPTTQFEQIPSTQVMQRQISDMNQRMHNQLDYLNAKRKLTLSEFIRMPIGLAVIAFIVVLLMLFLINPPFTQRATSHPMEEGQQSPLKAIVFAAIVGLAAFLTPLLYKKLCDVNQRSTS